MADTKLSIIVQAKDQASKDIERLNGKLGNLGKGFAAVGTVATAAAGAIAVVATGVGILGYNAIKAAGELEQQRVAFETMLGSAEKAGEFIKDLTNFAKSTPFELKGLENASKSLLAYGFAQEEILPNLKSLGDIASGVGMEKLPNLILAFGQVKAATKLTGMELRQFTEAGVPLLDQLAKQMNKPVAEIQAMVSAGEIGFPAVQAALAALTGEGGRFNNLMENQSKTFGGMVSNLKDSWDLFLRGAGEPLLDWAKAIIEKLIFITNNVLPPLVTRLDEFIKSINTNFPTLDGLKNKFAEISKKIEEKTGLISQLKEAWDRVATKITNDLMPALQELWVAMQPYMPLLELFAQIILGVVVLALKIFVEVVTTLIEKFIGFVTWITKAETALLERLQPAIGIMQAVLGALSNSIQWVIDKFNGMVSAANAAYEAAQRAASLVGRVGSAVATGGISEAVRAVTHQASGGIVTSPTHVLAGEEGPEAIIPLNRLAGAGGNGVNIYITGGSFVGVDNSEVARILGDRIIKQLQMTHRLG
ncbi:MAG: tape measure protein [Patescibacteria group bacterium]